MKEINRLSGSQVRSVPIKNFSRHQQSVFQSFRTEVNMTPIATLSCKETFTISHYLNRLVRCTQTINWVKHFIQTVFFSFFCSPHLSNTANKRVYGECNNPDVHSHKYTVEVITRGTVSQSIGTVMSLSHLKSLLKSTVANKLHGKNLDYEINFFRTVVSSIYVMQFFFHSLVR